MSWAAQRSRRTKRLGGGRKVIMADPWVMALARQAMSFTDLAAGPDAAEKETLNRFNADPENQLNDDETVPWELQPQALMLCQDDYGDVENEAFEFTGNLKLSVHLFSPCLRSLNPEEVRRRPGLEGPSGVAAPFRLTYFFRHAWFIQHGKEAEILAYDLSTTISETFLAYALLRVSLLLEHARELDTPVLDSDQDHLILVTRTTIDSTFHPEYLSAVTYAFLHSGLKRSRTIYQPPIFFLEDYGQQRWLTRYASMMLAQTSLSSLTDGADCKLQRFGRDSNSVNEKNNEIQNNKNNSKKQKKKALHKKPKAGIPEASQVEYWRDPPRGLRLSMLELVHMWTAVH
ncbi:hypothetical protein AK812_SmicGene2653 [Symbiodinium microadriaticum]|uniref:Uncharacterized protein n=1 Tax=Symbiodinium microadriaticum TaxID=2951 RepID=A0A1Q9F144_SYMMI|nr:hypothetical protein AK812_SmicGene2653 [Symbiodinium microadriaticum]